MKKIVCSVFSYGHSNLEACVLYEDAKFVIGGNMLFRESIGRTDLAKGNHAALLKHTKSTIVLPMIILKMIFQNFC